MLQIPQGTYPAILKKFSTCRAKRKLDLS